MPTLATVCFYQQQLQLGALDELYPAVLLDGGQTLTRASMVGHVALHESVHRAATMALLTATLVVLAPTDSLHR